MGVWIDSNGLPERQETRTSHAGGAGRPGSLPSDELPCTFTLRGRVRGQPCRLCWLQTTNWGPQGWTHHSHIYETFACSFQQSAQGGGIFHEGAVASDHPVFYLADRAKEYSIAHAESTWNPHNARLLVLLSDYKDQIFDWLAQLWVHYHGH